MSADVVELAYKESGLLRHLESQPHLVLSRYRQRLLE